MPAAQSLLAEIIAGVHECIQPPHWLAEIIGVMARRHPDLVGATLAAIHRLGIEIATEDAIYQRAAELAAGLKQHVFDTLYHAVALERGASFVTADERYFAAAAKEGAIQRLGEFKTF